MFVYTIIPKHVAIAWLLGIYTLLHKKINKKIYTIDDTIDRKQTEYDWLLDGIYWNVELVIKSMFAHFKPAPYRYVWMLEKCYIPPVYTA